MWLSNARYGKGRLPTAVHRFPAVMQECPAAQTNPTHERVDGPLGPEGKLKCGSVPKERLWGNWNTLHPCLDSAWSTITLKAPCTEASSK